DVVDGKLREDLFFRHACSATIDWYRIVATGRAYCTPRAVRDLVTPSPGSPQMPLTSRGFPLLLTFDLDGETMWTSRDAAAAKRPIPLSQGAYGWKTGVPRILELLQRYDIRSTFFVP